MNDVRMKGFSERASVIEARALICERTGPLGLERVPFRTAGGRILAEDIVSDRNVPPHDRSAMDGYAVRAEDVGADDVTLKVIGELKAAEQLPRAVGPGEAVRVMTGAKIPEGANAVIMVEDTEDQGEVVRIKRAAMSGQHILKTGEDLMAGRPVLHKGRLLRPQDVSMLVTVGALEVAVQRRPRVRIVPTGTELVRAGQRPKGSEVVESNSFLLEGLALRDGADPMLHPIVQDDRETLTKVLTEPGADLIVVTGGSSVGKEDYAPVIARELGELPIHGVHVKPASPTGIGFIDGRPVVLAPGYPVASFIAWDLFVRTIIQRMLGRTPKPEVPDLPYPKTRAVLGEALRKPENRVMVLRVLLEEQQGGLPKIQQIPGGAALLSTVTRADGFIYLPAGQQSWAEGAELDVYLY